MAEILQQAGLPDGCYNVVTGSGRTIGQALTEHMDVDMLSFTGSTAVGRSCLQAAGSNFKKLGLELGGKNPQIVFADADLEDAADGVAFGIGFNTGQCCVSGARLIVEALGRRQVRGDGRRETEEGPGRRSARRGDADRRDHHRRAERHDPRLHREGQAMRARRLVTGGKALDIGGGQYIAPTVFADVTARHGDRAGRDLRPGPDRHALRHAGRGDRDRQRHRLRPGGQRLDEEHRQGADRHPPRPRGPLLGQHDAAGGPELPIGGFKQSGWGREAGVYGVEEYTQIKSVHIEIGKRDPWVE